MAASDLEYIGLAPETMFHFVASNRQINLEIGEIGNLATSLIDNPFVLSWMEQNDLMGYYNADPLATILQSRIVGPHGSEGLLDAIVNADLSLNGAESAYAIYRSAALSSGDDIIGQFNSTGPMNFSVLIDDWEELLENTFPNWGHEERMAFIRTLLLDQMKTSQSTIGVLTDGLNERIEGITAGAECFVAGTQIAMADGSRKPIEDVSLHDRVIAHAKCGGLTSGEVLRVFRKSAKQVLDFWGTGVTPGHSYFCADGKEQGKHIILLDILRQDAAVQKVDGSLMRASTGADVESPLDGFVQAVTGQVGSDGQLKISASKSIRHGTRVILDDGRDICIADVITAGGGTLREDGLIATDDCPEGMPFHWTFSETLPNPEDYILKRSGTTLEDIYKAAEWEHHKPQMPAPMMYEGVPVEPAAPRQREDMPRNEPMYMDELLRKAERSIN